LKTYWILDILFSVSELGASLWLMSVIVHFGDLCL